MLLKRGRVLPRPGMELRSEVVVGGAYVACIHAVRISEQGLMVVGEGVVGEASHKVKIYYTDGFGGSPVAVVDDWMDPALSTEKVVAMAAESGERVFVAHDEAVLSRRAPTVAFDPATIPPSITELSAAWAGGDNKLRFRGVAAWNDALVGWGFGTNADAQPAYVRISDPGEPEVFQDVAWQFGGVRGDPVIGCIGVTAGLLMYKAAETHIVLGRDANNYQTRDLEKGFGLAGSRLALESAGYVYTWSLEGPREGEGGPSRDISWPLGLPWPRPQDIVATDRLARGFSVWLPVSAVVLFVFGDWVYAYSPAEKKWAWWQLAFELHAGGILFSPSGWVGASRGAPLFAAAVRTGDVEFTVSWAHSLAEGDELTEVWYRKVGDAWPGAASFTQAMADTDVVIAGLEAGADYEVALRYNRDGLFSTGYGGAPNTWPAESRGTFQVPLAPVAPAPIPPADLTGSDERRCEPVDPPAALPCVPTVTYALSWTVTMPDAEVVVESQLFGDPDWVEEAVLAAGTAVFDISFATEVGGSPPDSGGRSFRVRHLVTVGLVQYPSDPSNVVALG